MEGATNNNVEGGEKKNARKGGSKKSTTAGVKAKGGAGKAVKRVQANKRDNIAGITNPAIRRIARRGGIKRVSKAVFNESRGIMTNFMNTIIRDAVAVTEASGKKTVSMEDVHYSLQRNGRTLYGSN